MLNVILMGIDHDDLLAHYLLIDSLNHLSKHSIDVIYAGEADTDFKQRQYFYMIAKIGFFNIMNDLGLNLFLDEQRFDKDLKFVKECCNKLCAFTENDVEYLSISQEVFDLAIHYDLSKHLQALSIKGFMIDDEKAKEELGVHKTEDKFVEVEPKRIAQMVKSIAKICDSIDPLKQTVLLVNVGSLHVHRLSYHLYNYLISTQHKCIYNLSLTPFAFYYKGGDTLETLVTHRKFVQQIDKKEVQEFYKAHPINSEMLSEDSKENTFTHLINTIIQSKQNSGLKGNLQIINEVIQKSRLYKHLYKDASTPSKVLTFDFSSKSPKNPLAKLPTHELTKALCKGQYFLTSTLEDCKLKLKEVKLKDTDKTSTEYTVESATESAMPALLEPLLSPSRVGLLSF